MPKWSVLFLPVKRHGRCTGSRFSPFLFSLHTDSLPSCHGRLLKCADGLVLGNSYSKDPNQEGLDDDLSRLAEHGSIINKTKCVECLFYIKNTSSQLPFSFLNGEALSRDQTVLYLGVYDLVCRLRSVNGVIITGLISNPPTVIEIGKNIYVKASCH